MRLHGHHSASASKFPLLQTLVLCTCKVAEASVVCFIMPFVNQMVAGFGISATSSARYAGIIESALVCSEALTAPFWGGLADRNGRKLLLVIGLTAFTFACIGIGFSTHLWMAIAARCISGILGAVSVLIRTVEFEITDTIHVDRVLQYLAPCWAIGAALGPMIGGGLARPAETMPSIFIAPIWSKYPYLLPSLATAAFPATAALGCFFFIPETLHKSKADNAGQRTETGSESGTEAETETKDDEGVARSDMSIWDLIFENELLYVFYCNAFLAFVSMAYCAAFMMMASADLSDGGLGLTPWQLGLMLATSSGLGIIFGTYVLPLLVRKTCGWYSVLRIASLAHVVLFPLIALAGVTARAENGLGPLTIAVIGLILVAYEVGEISYTSIDVAFSDRAPTGCLGRVNGLSLSSASAGRMLAPVFSGQLWSLGFEIPAWWGRHLIWLSFTLLALVWWLSTIRLHSPLECRAAKLVRSTFMGNEEGLPLLFYQESYGSVEEDLSGSGILPQKDSVASSTETLVGLLEAAKRDSPSDIER